MLTSLHLTSVQQSRSPHSPRHAHISYACSLFQCSRAFVTRAIVYLGKKPPEADISTEENTENHLDVSRAKERSVSGRARGVYDWRRGYNTPFHLLM